MQLFHTRPVASAIFDDPNLVSCAGLVPIISLAQQCDLPALADMHLSVPTDKGANAGAKVTALVAGMVAGADSIEDMALLRHGAMGSLFDRPVRAVDVGFVPAGIHLWSRPPTRRRRHPAGDRTARSNPGLAGIDGPVLVDIDDTVIEVHGYAKQGSGYGYSGVRGLNALITTVTTERAAPVIARAATAQRRVRVRARSCPDGGRHRGRRAATAFHRNDGTVLLRADSAFYGHPSVAAAIRGGAQVSITVRLDPNGQDRDRRDRRRGLDAHRVHRRRLRRDHRQWISRAEVAEIAFTAFSSRKATEQVPGRLVVRRIPDLNPSSNHGQATLFDTWRFHAFFTTSDLDTVSADKTHRGHAIIEQVHADLKDSALAHLPSGRFTANAAWLVPR